MRSATFAGLLTAVCLLRPAPVLAVDPFVVDDARVNDPGQCQIEVFRTSQRRDPERSSGFTLGCAPKGFFMQSECDVGSRRANLGEAGVDKALSLQWKMLFRPIDEEKPGGWGYGLSIGSSRDRPAGETAAWNHYFNLLGGLTIIENRLILHGNFGAVRDKPAQRTQRTWGAALELALSERWSGIAEHYKDDAARASSQAGLRYMIIPDQLEMDVLTGYQPAGDSRRNWTALGLRLFF